MALEHRPQWQSEPVSACFRAALFSSIALKLSKALKGIFFSFSDRCSLPQAFQEPATKVPFCAPNKAGFFMVPILI